MNAIYYVLLILTVVIFFILLLVIHINKGGIEVFDLFWFILGGLLAATFFVTKAILSPLPDYKFKTDILLVEMPYHEILPLQNIIIRDSLTSIADGYRHILEINLAYKAKLKNKNFTPSTNIVIKEDPEYFLDLIEWSSVMWLVHKYNIHWQIDTDWFDGISGGGGGINKETNAEKETDRIFISELLKDNRFSQVLLEYKNAYFCVPKNIKVKYKKINNLYRIITFKNSNITFEITLNIRGGERLGGSLLADKIRKYFKIDADQENLLWAHHATVNFIVKLNKLLRFSPLTNKQEKWAKTVIELYNNDFSWYLLRDRINKVLK